jgi:hypothetical protein
MYLDIIRRCLSKAARGVLEMLDPATYKFGGAFGRGLAKGEKKGWEKGRTEALVEVALALLSHRFGPIPEAIQARVSSASFLELKALLTRILDATTLAEALGQLE